MRKQDRQGARTPAALERKYDFTEQAVKINRLESEIINVGKVAAKYVTVGDLESGKTTIRGNCIKTGIIQSSNYKIEGGNVKLGMSIDLDAGVMNTPNFAVTSAGEMFATAGHIGGFDISPNGLTKTIVTDTVTEEICVRPSEITSKRTTRFDGGDITTVTKMLAGGLHIEKTHYDPLAFDGTFLTMTVNGETYSLFIDPDSMTVNVLKE